MQIFVFVQSLKFKLVSDVNSVMQSHSDGVYVFDVHPITRGVFIYNTVSIF